MIRPVSLRLAGLPACHPLPYSFCHPAFFIKQKDIAFLADNPLNCGIFRQFIILYHAIPVEGRPAACPEQKPVFHKCLLQQYISSESRYHKILSMSLPCILGCCRNDLHQACMLTVSRFRERAQRYQHVQGHPECGCFLQDNISSICCFRGNGPLCMPCMVYPFNYRIPRQFTAGERSISVEPDPGVSLARIPLTGLLARKQSSPDSPVFVEDKFVRPGGFRISITLPSSLKTSSLPFICVYALDVDLPGKGAACQFSIFVKPDPCIPEAGYVP